MLAPGSKSNDLRWCEFVFRGLGFNLAMELQSRVKSHHVPVQNFKEDHDLMSYPQKVSLSLSLYLFDSA